MSVTTGTRLGSYEIRGALGRGGAGEVYRAWDPRLEREVAVKILRERADPNPTRLERFVAEARAASALNHPNILTVFDAAVEGDTPYIVSELIEGTSLRAEVRGGPVPIRRLLDLGSQIADGLAEAHAADIVHRDLKPENIMVTPGGRVKILDFGLARTTGLESSGSIPANFDQQTQTETGLLIGTIPYMSPEQARGSSADYRSDQFSFGLILYEMAAGRQAFRRDTPAETLDAIINEEPPPLPEVNPQTPLLLWWIVERCLSKNPADRYASTADLYRDLRHLRNRLPDAVARQRQSDGANGEAQPSRLRPRVALVAFPVLLLGLAAFLWALLAEPVPDTSALRFTPFATNAAYEGYPVWSPDGQTIAFVAEVNGILQVHTQNLNSPTPAKVTDSPYDCKHPFWSPDGKRIYYITLVRDREGIRWTSAAGGADQVLVENATRAALSPDGHTLAFLRDEARADIVGTASLYLATPGGTEPWSREAVEAAAVKYTGFNLLFVEGALSFSPDGRLLGLCAVPGPFPLDMMGRGWQFWVIPLADGAAPYRRFASWTGIGPRVTSFSWLNDNRHVVIAVSALSTPGWHLWQADVRTDRVWPLTRSADSELYPSVAPDGTRLVFTRGESHYDLVQVSPSGDQVKPIVDTARNEADPAWSGDGQLLAYVTDRTGQDEIWVRNATGQPLDRPLITGLDFDDADPTVLLAAPSFSPDGRRIAYLRTGGFPLVPLQIFYSSAVGGPAVKLLAEDHKSFQGAPTWSPDGQWIAFSEWMGSRWELSKVRVGSGEAPVRLRSDGAPNAVPVWSPRNDWITWETESDFVLVSPDGSRERVIPIDFQWLVHAWSKDGAEILGIVETDELRLALMALDVRTGRSRQLANLGPSPSVNNQVRGFSISADRSIATSFIEMRGDLWLLHGLKLPESAWQRLWSRLTGARR